MCVANTFSVGLAGKSNRSAMEDDVSSALNLALVRSLQEGSAEDSPKLHWLFQLPALYVCVSGRGGGGG